MKGPDQARAARGSLGAVARGAGTAGRPDSLTGVSFLPGRLPRSCARLKAWPSGGSAPRPGANRAVRGRGRASLPPEPGRRARRIRSDITGDLRRAGSPGGRSALIPWRADGQRGSVEHLQIAPPLR